MRPRQKEEASDIAKERVERLFSLAERAAAEGELAHADRYVQMAWNIKLKFRLRLSDYQKKLFCRKCRKFLAAGKTGRYRTEKGVLVVTCISCGYSRRTPMKKKSIKARPKPVKKARGRAD